MNINNIDFMIAVQIDHPDRMRNLRICLTYLNKIGVKNIYLKEYYIEKSLTECLKKEFKFNLITEKNNLDNFPRMKAINEIFKETKNDFVIIYDTDIILAKSSLENTVKLLSENADVVYPYDGHFYDIPKDTVDQLAVTLSTPIDINKCILFNPNSFGGSTAFRRNVFIEGGMCNPNFKNTGYDDNEILERFNKLRYRVKRAPGILLHLNHFRGNTSFNYNSFTDHNQAEYAKVIRMTEDELRKYIKTWQLI